MIDQSSRDTSAAAQLGGHPIHAMLVPFPVVCFTGAMVTDVAYWATASVMWETFSVWLITVGLLTAALAMIVGALDLRGSRQTQSISAAWIHAIGNLLVFVLSLVNVFVHSRDGYTAVVPEGLALSAIVVLLLVGTSWLGHSLVYRYQRGVK